MGKQQRAGEPDAIEQWQTGQHSERGSLCCANGGLYVFYVLNQDGTVEFSGDAVHPDNILHGPKPTESIGWWRADQGDDLSEDHYFALGVRG